MLPLGVVGHVVQLHRETADRAREALRHVLDPSKRPVLKATSDEGRFVNASAAVLSREWMRARFELPIQDDDQSRPWWPSLWRTPHTGTVIRTHLAYQSHPALAPPAASSPPLTCPVSLE